MNLLITFLITVTLGIAGAAWVGVLIDKMTSSFVSLAIFFPLFFLTVWLSWRMSVRLTAPKSTNPA